MADRSVEPRAVALAFMPLVCATMVLRLYLRGWMVKVWGWDDGLMVLAFVLFVVTAACIIAATYHGLGHNAADLSEHQAMVSIEYLWTVQIAFGLSTAACKISACLFLTRITIKRTHTRFLLAILIHTALLNLGMFIMNFVRCQPISYLWTRVATESDGNGTCLTSNQMKTMALTASSNLLLNDICLGVVTPVMLVWTLQMQRESKIAVVSILGLNIIATIATIIRIPYLFDQYAVDTERYLGVDVVIWFYIELSLSIIAANLATLGPILRSWLGMASQQDNSRRPLSTPKPPFRARGNSFRAFNLSFPLSTADGSIQSGIRLDQSSSTETQV